VTEDVAGDTAAVLLDEAASAANLLDRGTVELVWAIADGLDGRGVLGCKFQKVDRWP
jgi:hypothetical protein